jgi:hypothetical protein
MNELNLGFANVPLPPDIIGRVVRTPDGGFAIGVLHNSTIELGRVFVVPQKGGLLIEAFLTTGADAKDTAWRKETFEPIAQRLRAAVDLAMAK